MLKIILIFAILVISFSAFSKNCRDIQQLRGHRSEYPTIFTDGRAEQSPFYSCVQKVVSTIEKHRASDNRTLVNEIQSQGLHSMPKTEKIRLLYSLLGPDSFFTYFEGRYKKYDTIFSHFTFIGAAIEVHAVLTGGIEEKDGEGNRFVLPIYEEAGFDILNNVDDPIDFLISKLYSNGKKTGDYPLKENFTIGLSKIILFEVLRQKAREEGRISQFNRFAKKIRLGLRLPRHEITGKDLNPDFEYTVHDGYFLGARSYHMNVHSSNFQVSFDCTSFIQFCAFGIDSFEDSFNSMPISSDKFKFITYDFVKIAKGQVYSNTREKLAMEVINENFDLEELTDESQLIPGDMIVFKGHMLIFKGYKRMSDGKVVLRTIEAMGMENRSLAEFTRKIYGPQCDQFLWTRDQAISGDKIDAYIVRIKE